MLAHAGLDEPQRLVPELIIVTFTPILTHTKEPHLRSSNLNSLSPTIGVRFNVPPYAGAAVYGCCGAAPLKYGGFVLGLVIFPPVWIGVYALI